MCNKSFEENIYLFIYFYYLFKTIVLINSNFLLLFIFKFLQCVQF